MQAPPPENANPGDKNRKRGHGKRRKQHKRGKPNNAGKRNHDNTRKHRKSGSAAERKPAEARFERRATHGFKACSAIALPGEVQEGDGQIFEPLYRVGYTLGVTRQISREWGAGGALLWTLSGRNVFHTMFRSIWCRTVLGESDRCSGLTI